VKFGFVSLITMSREVWLRFEKCSNLALFGKNEHDWLRLGKTIERGFVLENVLD
jgi:hypothetical protein